MHKKFAVVAFLFLAATLCPATAEEPNAESPLLTTWAATRSTDKNVRSKSIGDLAKFGEAAVPILMEIWERGHTEDADSVVSAMTTLKPKSKVIAEVFARDVVRHKDKKFRACAAIILRLFPASEENVTALIEGLKDGDEWVVYQCVASLRMIGPEGKRACPRLAELVHRIQGTKQPLSWVEVLIRIQALHALAVLDAEAHNELIVSGITQAVRDHPKQVEVTMNAVAACYCLGVGGKKMIPVLVEIASDKEGYMETRQAAVKAVERILAEELKQTK